jgi:hypothetical protein
LASAKAQGGALPQHEFAGNRLQRSEGGRNEFAAMARRSCHARKADNLKDCDLQ